MAAIILIAKILGGALVIFIVLSAFVYFKLR